MLKIDRAIDTGKAFVRDVVDVNVAERGSFVEGSTARTPNWTRAIRPDGITFVKDYGVAGVAGRPIDDAARALQLLANQHGVTAIQVGEHGVRGVRTLADDPRVFRGVVSDDPRTYAFTDAVDALFGAIEARAR